MGLLFLLTAVVELIGSDGQVHGGNPVEVLRVTSSGTSLFLLLLMLGPASHLSFVPLRTDVSGLLFVLTAVVELMLMPLASKAFAHKFEAFRPGVLVSGKLSRTSSSSVLRGCLLAQCSVVCCSSLEIIQHRAWCSPSLSLCLLF